jgi:hypothetical protein
VADLLDPNPGLRTEAEWRELLGGLVTSLSRFCGIEFTPTSWYTGDDKPGYASSCNCVNVRGVVNAALRLEACGVVCISVNFGEAAWASADVLLFSGGERVLGPRGSLVLLVYEPTGWVSRGWVIDDYGEWESHATDARWQDAER